MVTGEQGGSTPMRIGPNNSYNGKPLLYPEPEDRTGIGPNRADNTDGIVNALQWSLNHLLAGMVEWKRGGVLGVLPNQ